LEAMTSILLIMLFYLSNSRKIRLYPLNPINQIKQAIKSRAKHSLNWLIVLRGLSLPVSISLDKVLASIFFNIPQQYFYLYFIFTISLAFSGPMYSYARYWMSRSLLIMLTTVLLVPVAGFLYVALYPYLFSDYSHPLAVFLRDNILMITVYIFSFHINIMLISQLMKKKSLRSTLNKFSILTAFVLFILGSFIIVFGDFGDYLLLISTYNFFLFCVLILWNAKNKFFNHSSLA